MGGGVESELEAERRGYEVVGGNIRRRRVFKKGEKKWKKGRYRKREREI